MVRWEFFMEVLKVRERRRCDCKSESEIFRVRKLGLGHKRGSLASNTVE